MKSRGIKFKIYAGNMGIMTNVPAAKRLLQIMSISFVLLVVLYVFILGTTVSNIIERRAHESRARTLFSEVGELELKFLSLSGKIDPDYGKSLGFIDGAEENFATRKSLGSVTFVNNEL